MVFCGECGANCGNQAATFCSECGHKLDPTSASSKANQPSYQTTIAEKPQESANPKSNQFLPGGIGKGRNIEEGLAEAFGLQSSGTQKNLFKTEASGLSAGSCKGCGIAVQGENIQALGAVWHHKCFKCGDCGEIFQHTGNRRVLEGKDSKPYCEKCFDSKFGEICKGCNKTAGSGGVIKALNAVWHPDCFKCTNCSKKFDSPGVYNKGGKPFCKNCA